MQSIPRTDAIAVIHSAESWQLTCNGKTVAVIERTWDDFHWFVFFCDAEGNLDCQHVRRSVAALKVCLHLWAHRNAAQITAFIASDEQSEPPTCRV